MASQEDYANVLLALTTLATAPVAAYPESGPMMLAKQGQDRAVGKLADEAMKKAQKKAKKKGKLGSVGQIAGTLAGAALAAPTGGMSLAAGAGLGGAIGGGLGGLMGGGEIDPAALSAAFAESAAGAEGSKQYEATKFDPAGFKRATYPSRNAKIPGQFNDDFLPYDYRR